MKIDFDAVNAAALHCLESLVTEWFPSGHREGHEYKVGSIAGEPGRSLSVNLRTGAWKDFSSNEGGSDPVSLLAAIRSAKMLDAARELADRLKTGVISQGVTAEPRPDSPTWVPIVPVPENVSAPSFKHHRFGKPSHTWTYRDAENRLIGYVHRFDLPDGGKDVVPQSYCRGGDGRQWRWLSFAKPRPLYGLELLAQDPTAGVIIVEGEKAADAARTICPGIVISWPGGGKAARYVDWAPLAGRKVVIIPDRDKPGFEAAEFIAGKIRDITVSVRIVSPPEGPEDGWDMADAVAEGWTRERVIEQFRAAPKPPEPEPVEELSSIDEPPPGWDEPIDTPPEMEPIPEAEKRITRPDDRIDDMPFRLLGVDGDAFFYMPDRGHQIVSLTASSHSKNNLMRLAPLQTWESVFQSKSGADWDAANNALIQRSQDLPKFDPRRIRGRGCWVDADDVVFHAGDRLVVNGVEREIPRYRSNVRAIYEGALEIPVDSAEVAANRDAAKLIELCEMLSWERPLYGKLLAGWLAIAPVCGALAWRPHLWVTGPSGSGKSWTVANIIQPIVGRTAVHVQGNTSEAGIRGQLGSDALPVVFDEAESEDRASQLRFDRVLELARQASTETGAGIVKGTATGGSVTYLIRSCFLFASIGVAAVKKADTSRVTVLPLRKNTGPDASAHFEQVKALWRDTVAQNSYCERIRSRSLKFAKTLRVNCETFSQVAVEFTGDKRSADQIGTLLAGAFSLTSTNEITREFAREWMAKQDWSGFQSEDIDSDENQCVARLFASSIRYEMEGKALTRSVSETVAAIQAIPNHASDSELARRAELKDALIRHGLKLHNDRLYVANQHPALERMFTDTPWAGSKWKSQLARVAGAKPENSMAFGKFLRQRAVSLQMN
jgi:putative DNA primase/helicase